MSARPARPLPPPDDDLLWDRLPGEPPKAYHAFCHYRDFGYGRSIDKAWRAHQAACLHRQVARTKRAEPYWFDWAVDFRWQDRVHAWDSEQDRQARTQIAKEQTEARKRHIRLSGAFQQALAVPARGVLEVLADPTVMQRLVQEARVSTKELLRLVNMVSWAARSIPELVQVERQALGLTADEVVAEDHPTDSYVTDLADRITRDPQLADKALDLLSELARPVGAGTADGASPPRSALTDGGAVVDGPAPRLPDEEAP